MGDCINLIAPLVFSIIFIEMLILNQCFKKMPILFKRLLSYFKLEIGDFRKTIFIPIVIILFFYHFMPYTKDIVLPIKKTVLSYITAVSITPIAEEMILRGIVLGVVFLFIPSLFKQLKKYRLFFTIAGLIISSCLFALLHDNNGVGSFVIRLIMGLIFGLFYLTNKRNLLPSIIAHSTNNLVNILLCI